MYDLGGVLGQILSLLSSQGEHRTPFTYLRRPTFNQWMMPAISFCVNITPKHSGLKVEQIFNISHDFCGSGTQEGLSSVILVIILLEGQPSHLCS